MEGKEKMNIFPTKIVVATDGSEEATKDYVASSSSLPSQAPLSAIFTISRW
jgi:hypothetical protein